MKQHLYNIVQDGQVTALVGWRRCSKLRRRIAMGYAISEADLPPLPTDLDAVCDAYDAGWLDYNVPLLGGYRLDDPRGPYVRLSYMFSLGNEVEFVDGQTKTIQLVPGAVYHWFDKGTRRRGRPLKTYDEVVGLMHHPQALTITDLGPLMGARVKRRAVRRSFDRRIVTFDLGAIRRSFDSMQAA